MILSPAKKTPAGGHGLEVDLPEYNQRIVNTYLKKYDGNVKKVADKLDIGKSTIYRMLKEDKSKETENKPD